MNNNLIYIAKITKPHGIKGQVKIISYSASPIDVFHYPILYDENMNEYKLKLCSEIGVNIYIASFNQNTSRNLAEEISGLKLYITKEMLTKVNDDEYYHHDLIDMQVLDLDKKLCGKIIAIHNFGAGDVIELQSENNKSSFYLPFNQEYVKEVNLDKGFLIFDFLQAGISS